MRIEWTVPLDNSQQGELSSNLLIDVPASELDISFEVVDEDSGEIFKVNPYERTCSCNWITNFPENIRRKLSPKDLRLFCDHMLTAVTNRGPDQEQASPSLDLTDLQKAMLANKYRQLRYREEFLDNARIVLGFSPERDWVQVFLRRDGKITFTDYSFSLIENRWSYGLSPRGLTKEVRDLIERVFNLIRKGKNISVDKTAALLDQKIMQEQQFIRRQTFMIDADVSHILKIQKEVENEVCNYKNMLATESPTFKEFIKAKSKVITTTKALIEARKVVLSERKSGLALLESQLEELESLIRSGSQFLPPEIIRRVL